MAHFYGTMKGSRGEATRCGTQTSGMRVVCASWDGAIRCHAFAKDGMDWVIVTVGPWMGQGPTERVLYDGPLGENGRKP